MSPKMPVAKAHGKKNNAKKRPERGLGRGLSSLLGDRGVAVATGIKSASMEGDITYNTPAADKVNKNISQKPLSGLKMVPVEWINVGPWQPRRHFDKANLDELAASIRKNGIVQPLLLRPHPTHKLRFQLVAGERRWRAAQLARTHEVPAIIRGLTDVECFEIALIENIQRSDLSVVEEAQGYQKLLDQNQYTQEQLSEIIGKSRSHIANILRLLLLPESVQTLLLERKITMGQARPLIGHGQSEILAKIIVTKNLSARQAEALAKKGTTPTKIKHKKRPKSSDIRELERQAADKLGLVFNIDWDEDKDRGEVVIGCQSLDQMTYLLGKLGIG